MPAPHELSGCVISVSPAGLNLSGIAGIDVWADESGNGNHLTQSTANRRPLLTMMDGWLAARFWSRMRALYFDLVDLSALTAGEMFMAVALDNDPQANTTTSWYLGHTDNGFGAHYVWVDGNIYETFGTADRKTVGNPTPSVAAVRAYNVRSGAGDWAARMDGATLHSTGTNTVAFPSAPKIGVQQGTISDSTLGLQGTILAFALFDHVLDSGDRDDMDTHFAQYQSAGPGYEAPPSAGPGVWVKRGGVLVPGGIT